MGRGFEAFGKMGEFVFKSGQILETRTEEKVRQLLRIDSERPDRHTVLSNLMKCINIVMEDDVN